MVDTGAALKLAAAIQVQEGWYAGSVSYRNNNPGNLRYVGQAGATAGAGGFAAFSSYQDGLSALVSQIQLDAVRGTDAAKRPVVTVADLITSWAPPNENNTAAYIASVERQTGFSGSDELNSLGSGGAAVTAGNPSAGNPSAGDQSAGDQSAGDDGEFSVSSLPPSSLAAVGVIGASLLWAVFR